jgi:hypothetical protein
VSDIVPGVGRAAFRKFGFVESAVVQRWEEIAGAKYARHSAPDSIRFPAGKRSGGTLTIVCEGAFAPTLAHVEPQLIERVNRFFGYAAVAKIALRHAEVPRKKAAKPVPEDSAPIAADVGVTLKTIGDPGLRATLESLARKVGATSGPPVFD